MKTETLLKKYLETGLSDEERFLLEKRALDDQLLADAWEGLQLHGSPEKVKNWNALQARWQATHIQKQKTRIIPLRRWAPIAVAASILIVAGTFFWLNPAQNQMDPSGAVALEVDLSDELELNNYESNEVAKIQEAVEASSEIRSAVRKEEAAQSVSSTKSIQQSSESLTPEIVKDQAPTIAYNRSSKEEDASNLDGFVKESIVSDEVQGIAISPHEGAEIVLEEVALNVEQEEAVPELVEDASSDALVINDVAREEVTPATIEYTKIETDSKALALSLKEDVVLARKTALDQKVKKSSSYFENGNPDIGKDAFFEIVLENGLPKSYAFMRRLKPPLQVRFRFTLDQNRIPQDIQIVRGINPNNLVEKILSESGTWTIENPKEPIQVEFRIPLIGLKD